MISKIRSKVTSTMMPLYTKCMAKGMTHQQFMNMMICFDIVWVTVALALIWKAI